MRVFSYCPETDVSDWDSLIQNSNNGVFLHSRKFLSYHKDRFVDRSLVFRDDKGKLIAVLPAAQDGANSSKVISHPGITYGGGIYRGRMALNTVEEMIELAIEEYKQRGVAELIYKCVPLHIQAKPAQLDEYLFWRKGATIVRRDLWNVITLNGSRTLSKGRKWGVRKAQKNGLITEKTDSDDAYIGFHGLLTRCLDERHQAEPIHSCEEMCTLRDMFSDQITLWTVRDNDGHILAGAWMFMLGQIAWHTQYIASNEEGRACQAVDLLIESIIKTAEMERINSFSFGASTEQQGKEFNAGLFNFKAGFGFGAILQDTYRFKI